MANPFLMTDDDGLDANDLNSNPFLMSENDTGTSDYCADNPFMVQTASNPFADFGGGGGGETTATTTSVVDYYATTSSMDTTITSQAPFYSHDITNSVATSNALDAVQPIDSAMSFFGTTISDDADEPVAPQKPIGLNIFLAENLTHLDDNLAYSSDEELKQRNPPLRPVPPSQTTQDLILSVADQLDQTSSHLLGRLPRTRTPSPVSMRDFQSPSPTPDVGDLLDVSDMMSDMDHQLPHDDDFPPPPPPVTNENPFGLVDAQPEPMKVEPVRPPPPRPTPPRPTPPRRPSPPSAVQSTFSAAPPPRPADPPPMETDLFDMFGTAEAAPKRPPPPKSNQDIMNLFSAPKQPETIAPQQLDFLSGDILSMDNNELTTLPSVMGAPTTQQPQMSAMPPANSLQHQQQLHIVTTDNSTVIANPEQQLTCDTNLSVISSVSAVSSISAASSDSAISSEPPVSAAPGILTPPIESSNLPVKEYSPQMEKENFLDDVDAISQVNEAVDYQPAESMAEDHLNFEPTPAAVIQAGSDVMDYTLQYVDATIPAAVNPFASPEESVVVEAPIPVMKATPAPIVPRKPPVPVPPSRHVEVPAPRPPSLVTSAPISIINGPAKSDEFDAFAAKFDMVKKDDHSLLDGFGGKSPTPSTTCAWGDDDFKPDTGDANGFGNDDGFDSFLAMQAPPAPQPTPFDRNDSHDSDEAAKEFSVVIRPKDSDMTLGLATPILAPPPRSSQNNSIYSGDSSPRFNPFDKGDEVLSTAGSDIPHHISETGSIGKMERSDSQETPQTPLFDDDVSQPLEDFPRVIYVGDGWEMQLRQPNKKKITGQRFWKKIFLRLVYQGDNPVLQILNAAKDKEPFQELPLQACYSVSEISAQQFDQFGKIFTVKLQYIFYKERPGVRPGQVTKAERLTTKLSKFAAYAIQGDYEGVKEFGSDLRKLGLPVEHAPQVSQLFKIGSHNFEDLKQFSVCIDEHLFKYNAHRDRALNYKSEEVQLTAVDELYVEQDAEGHVMKQICRVRLFFLGFLSGMPTIELGVNDLWRQGKEVVGRHDIIPVVTEEWIRLEGVEFHSCVQQNEYERSRTIRFQPPDACYIELMRFRVRPPKNRELPLQLKATWCVTGNRVELRADVLVPGFASRKLGQIPCEDVAIRFPIPECWIYLFRVEKHFRYGSVKSAHRRTGKIKGIDRFLGTVDQLQESLIEVTSGQAKYEHHHRAIVWRCPRLPKEGQGAYTTHQLVVRMALTSYDQIPDQLAPYCYVEFTMPATQVSHVTVRSVSVQDSESDDPPEKYVRYLARHEYRVGIEHTTGETQNAYLSATATSKPKEEPIPEREQASTLPIISGSDSGSDSN